MNIKLFFSATPKQQSKLFPKIKTDVENIAKKVLWCEFKKMNAVLVAECTSFILEKLVTHHTKIVEGKERSFVYSIGKRYFQEWFFDRNGRTIFIEDLLFENEKQPDKMNWLKTEDPTGDLESIKIEAVNRFQELIQNASDKNSILIVCSIMECVLTQQDYNHQFLSLFLHRKTNLSFDALYKGVKSMSLNLSLSRREYFENIFKKYSRIEPLTADGKIITEWERRAIFYFENRHERFRGRNYEARNRRITEKVKIKSTPLERIYWMKTYEGQNMEGDYYNRFGKSFRTFKSDKRMTANQ